jgi:hypothetical protein
MAMPRVHFVPPAILLHSGAGLLPLISTLYGRLLNNVLNRYRPERYYMRGPGPRWHAKHAGERPGLRAE